MPQKDYSRIQRKYIQSGKNDQLENYCNNADEMDKKILKNQTPQNLAKDQKLNMKLTDELKMGQKLALQEEDDTVCNNVAQMREYRDNNMVMHT